jgi:hypothetical protein
LDDNTPLKAEFRKDLLDGCMTITAKAVALQRADNNKTQRIDQDFLAIPYALWSNRSDASKMTVWIPRKN